MSKKTLSKYNTLKLSTNKAEKLYLPYNIAKNFYSTNTTVKDTNKNYIKAPSQTEQDISSATPLNVSDDYSTKVWNVRKIDPNSKYYNQIYEKGSARKIIVPKGAVHPDLIFMLSFMKVL